jgi:hypothetical protein
MFDGYDTPPPSFLEKTARFDWVWRQGELKDKKPSCTTVLRLISRISAERAFTVCETVVSAESTDKSRYAKINCNETKQS